MKSYLFILGREKKLAFAELVAVFGSRAVSVIGTNALVSTDDQVNIDRFGGVIKIAEILENSSTNYELNIKSIVKEDNLKRVGLSFLAFKPNLKEVRLFLRSLKDEFKVHTVLGEGPDLTSAEVINGQLLKSRSAEIIIQKEKNKFLIAKTLQVQNLKRYTLRDLQKPRPSGKNGMLPPKLAQILLNLAQLKPADLVADVFCGSGTVLQEALLLGYRVQGSDINPKIIKDCIENLSWLNARFKLNIAKQPSIEVKDATSDNLNLSGVNAIVSETYLGPPLSYWPGPSALEKIMQECNDLVEKFLKNTALQIKSGIKVVLALPSWNDPKTGKAHDLKVLEKFDDLGYNINKDTSQLSYRRKDQLVGRRIVVLIRK